MTASLFLRLLGLTMSLGFGYLVFEYEGAGQAIRRPVSGSIRVDGRRLPEGRIQFVSTSNDMSRGAVANVADGAYTIEQEDGLVVGRYQVCINGLGIQDQLRMRVGERLEDPIPARFNSQSEIFVEVTADGCVVGFDFDLK